MCTKLELEPKLTPSGHTSWCAKVATPVTVFNFLIEFLKGYSTRAHNAVRLAEWQQSYVRAHVKVLPHLLVVADELGVPHLLALCVSELRRIVIGSAARDICKALDLPAPHQSTKSKPTPPPEDAEEDLEATVHFSELRLQDDDKCGESFLELSPASDMMKIGTPSTALASELVTHCVGCAAQFTYFTSGQHHCRDCMRA